MYFNNFNFAIFYIFIIDLLYETKLFIIFFIILIPKVFTNSQCYK